MQESINFFKAMPAFFFSSRMEIRCKIVPIFVVFHNEHVRLRKCIIENEILLCMHLDNMAIRLFLSM